MESVWGTDCRGGRGTVPGGVKNRGRVARRDVGTVGVC